MDITSLSIPDYASLSVSKAQNKLEADAGIAVLSKTMDTYEQNGEALIRMMELAANPGLGANIDVMA